MSDVVERLRNGKCPDCNGWGKVVYFGGEVDCRCRGKYEKPISIETRDEAADAIESLRAENARLTKQVANLEARGIHSCNDECQRPLCVAQRENARLREALEAARQALWNALDHLGVDDPDADATIQQIVAALAHKDVNA